MKSRLHLGACALAIAGVSFTTTAVLAVEPAALQAEVRQTNNLDANHGSARVQAQLAGDFSAFAGSPENAQSLFLGLRNGSPVTLRSTSVTGGTTGTAPLTFDPMTRPMGNGNVYISLALARQQLASYGITNPTPQQIQAVLTGGTVTPPGATAQPVVVKGILVQRAGGMGWGEIAKSSGMNLGQAVSGLKSQNALIVAGPATPGTGITTATGSAAQSNAQVRSGATGAEHGNSMNEPAHNRGSGIVSATGGALGGGLNGQVQAGARAGGAGTGIVTGTGVTASSRGGANGQGQGRGLLKN